MENVKEKTAKKPVPSLNQIDYLMGMLIEHEFVYNGKKIEAMPGDTRAFDVVFRKLYHHGKPAISLGKYKYFLALVYKEKFEELAKKLEELS